ncbi:hypothetical protein SERLA73DRAFT_175611 [Serpula lacrymans var. lacrymans S7.3]|uniref:Chitin-binding type-4 domain-containing protein n=2 Tax=Serpula lacrymans var. lacrymans TaxID=341189 RepID=F8PKW3_SERL3|nr:uncharacterized protein SERLADRAFT_458151 [Serpula lacrymans var. lacrymans S7.9]EGO03922.1 hypothetical protein SERLA73DRAFT_175611 [Serpula lacrymans var. lacrymans S7.3]EGO29845.1 hypothetical protein SERLADRAFT_458151 [Serpula lacrymans var. lacrymans S7.9]
MFAQLIALVSAASIVSTVCAHGVISSPPRRLPGPAFEAACGSQIYSIVSSDQYGNQQQEEQNINSETTSACELYLCKGLEYADNTNNVQQFTANQVVPIQIDLRAPHTGVANVSVVATASNSVIAGPLISFDPAYSTSTAIPANQTSFSVTIPNLNGQCATAGECVLQWWWDARSIDQTYMSCVDFTQ